MFIIFCALNQLTGANTGLRPRKSAGKKIAESGKGFKLSTLIVGTAARFEGYQGREHGKKSETRVTLWLLCRAVLSVHWRPDRENGAPGHERIPPTT